MSWCPECWGFIDEYCRCDEEDGRRKPFCPEHGEHNPANDKASFGK